MGMAEAGSRSPAKAGWEDWGVGDHHMNVVATWEPAKALLRGREALTTTR